VTTSHFPQSGVAIVSMTYGIPYKNSLDICDHARQPFSDFHKLIELKKVLNENMDY